MYQLKMKLLLAYAVSIGLLGSVNGNCDGENWMPYKNEKCVKIIDQLATFDAATEICLAEQPENTIQQLLSIKSLEEQTFWTEYIFNQTGVIDDVWLGANRVESTDHFQWNDGSTIQFANWEDGAPSDDSEKSCVQMVSHLYRESTKVDDGQWNDASCLRRNVVACQKLQNLPVAEIQRLLLENIRNVEYLNNNPVPIGFIYVELPNQPNPQQLWPSLIWQDVTTEYAGLFFRAAGGSAADFNSTQDYSAPRLNSVQVYDDPDSAIERDISVDANGAYSTPAWSGCYFCSQNDKIGLKFRVSSGEVRPINTAIRIWSRVE